MIYITEKAANKVKELADAEEIGHYKVRVKVQGGGCASFMYDLMFDDKILDMDEIFEFDSIKIICDCLSFYYLDESIIDYVDTEFGGGFKFNSPSVKHTCGCGSSVSF